MLSLLIQQLQGAQQAPTPTKRTIRRPLKGTVEKYRKALCGAGWCDMQQVSRLTGVRIGGLNRTIKTLVDHGYLESKLGAPGLFNRRPIYVRWL